MISKIVKVLKEKEERIKKSNFMRLKIRENQKIKEKKRLIVSKERTKRRTLNLRKLREKIAKNKKKNILVKIYWNLIRENLKTMKSLFLLH